jgi:tetratricopeptide (TPR) repeat protein
MRQKQSCRALAKWPLPFFFLLLLVGLGSLRAQTTSGPALVLKGIAQYQDSALFRAAIATLEQAAGQELDSRDSTLAYFYLGFCHFKLGEEEEGEKFFRAIARRDPGARLPARTEEFAARFARIKQQVREQPDAPFEDPLSPAAAPTPRSLLSPPESVYVRQPVYVSPRLGNYVAGASAGAVLGLASYFTSVLFDNMAVDKLKAYGVAGDSATAAELKQEAMQYHSLGDVFYYSSYPLIAVGFYAGLKLSERIFPRRVSVLGDNSPTRVFCALDADLNLTLGIRRSLW